MKRLKNYAEISPASVFTVILKMPDIGGGNTLNEHANIQS